MPDDRPRDRARDERRRLFRYALWAGGAAAAAATGFYAAFWLPYRDPDEATPWVVRTIPAVAPPAGTSEDARPTEFGWVDREAGVVRIPVEDAMAILPDRLPVRGNGAGAAAGPERVRIPTDAGSGRPVRHEPRR